MRDVFQKIHDENLWRSDESVSGRGSELAQTARVREELPTLFHEYGIRTVLDIPCGDFHWFREMNFDPAIMYCGADIVPNLIYENNKQYSGHRPDGSYAAFVELDITTGNLPQADLILVRDLLGHFSNADVQRALRNIKRSKPKYLLATTFPAHHNSGDIQTGQWRPINLAEMWGLGTPIEYLVEDCTEGDGEFADKSLGLWRL